MKNRIALWSVYLIWGSTYLAMHVAVETLPPLFSGSLRYVISGFLLIGLSLLLKLKIGKIGYKKAIFMSIFLIIGTNGCTTTANTMTDSSSVAICMATVPIWVLIINIATKESIFILRELIFVIIGFLGVAVVLLGSLSNLDVGIVVMKPLLISLLGAIMWSVGTCGTKKIKEDTSDIFDTFFSMILGGGGLFVLSCFTENPGLDLIRNVSQRSVIAMGYLIVFGSIVAFSCYSWLIKNEDSSKVASFAYVNPFVAMVLGCLLGKENLNHQEVIGSFLILSSVYGLKKGFH